MDFIPPNPWIFITPNTWILFHQTPGYYSTKPLDIYPVKHWILFRQTPGYLSLQTPGHFTQDIDIDELSGELPEMMPRFIAYSSEYKHKDGRVSYPLSFIYCSPAG